MDARSSGRAVPPESHRGGNRVPLAMEGASATSLQPHTSDRDQLPVWCMSTARPCSSTTWRRSTAAYVAAFRHRRATARDGSMSRAPQSIIYAAPRHAGARARVITTRASTSTPIPSTPSTCWRTWRPSTSLALDNAGAYRQLNEQEHEIRRRAAELATVNRIGGRSRRSSSSTRSC